MNIFIMVLSITTVQLPALVLRYLPFAKLITEDTKKKLLLSYSLCFILQHIILYVLLKQRYLYITPLSYKVLILALSLTYVTINILLIKGYLYQHLFVFNMQGGYSFFIHSLVAIILGRHGAGLPVYIQFSIQSSVYILLFIIMTIPLWNSIKNSLVFKQSISQDYFWNIIWLIPTLAVYGNFIATTTVNTQWINSWPQLLSRLVMIVAIILSWRFINLDFENLDQMLQLENTNKMLIIQNEAIESQANIILENDKKISILKHDMRHHLLLLSSLIEYENYPEATSLISQLNTSLQNTKPIMYCKNTIINSALLVYITRAEENRIKVVTEVDIPKDIPWNSHDIALLIANSLENSVIASMKQDEDKREIHMVTRYTEKKLAINIQNRFDDEVLFGESGFPITKETDHGIGIQSIISVVEKYSAHVSFSHNDGWFTMSFLFSEYFIKE